METPPNSCQQNDELHKKVGTLEEWYCWHLNFPILQVSRLLKEIRNGYIRLSRICIIDICIYIYYIILYTCRRISHCFLRAFHMVYTSTKCFFQTKARRAKGAEKMGRGIHVLWIRFGGPPNNLGRKKKQKTCHEENSIFFVHQKLKQRWCVVFYLYSLEKVKSVFLLCWCVIDCAWIPFFWLGEVVRRPTKFAFYFDRWQLAAVVTWLTSCNSKWTIQKLYFMLGVKLKHLCSSSLGEV